jgi:hypothetical protein
VRSLDRLDNYARDTMEGNSLFEYWNDKWRAFRKSAEQRDGSSLRWLPSSGIADQETLIRQLQNDGDACCLGMPHPKPDTDLLVALIWAGIPVALWAREPPVPVPRESNLSALLTPSIRGQSLAELRLSIKAARRSGSAHGCLALLWDDPTRVPLRFLPQGAYTDDQLEGV